MVDSGTRAYHHREDGQTWLRIMPPDGMNYDEPITGWTLVLDTVRNRCYYRHENGTEITQA